MGISPCAGVQPNHRAVTSNCEYRFTLFVAVHHTHQWLSIPHRDVVFGSKEKVAPALVEYTQQAIKTIAFYLVTAGKQTFTMPALRYSDDP
ncbi:MAG: hypothetical protein WBC08_01620, partial [Rhodoferax sp.]